MEIVKTLNGLSLSMTLIKTYPNGKLFFCQERLCLTDTDNNEILSEDIIDLVEQVF